MEMRLERRPATDGAILGTLFIAGIFRAFTLERLGVEIAKGRYPVTITQSFRFNEPLPLIDVPGRSGIRVHAGNGAGDTSGCILVGQDHAATTLQHSRVALAAVQREIAEALVHGLLVWLTVTDAPTVPQVNV